MLKSYANTIIFQASEESVKVAMGVELKGNDISLLTPINKITKEDAIILDAHIVLIEPEKFVDKLSEEALDWLVVDMKTGYKRFLDRINELTLEQKDEMYERECRKIDNDRTSRALERFKDIIRKTLGNDNVNYMHLYVVNLSCNLAKCEQQTIFSKYCLQYYDVNIDSTFPSQVLYGEHSKRTKSNGVSSVRRQVKGEYWRLLRWLLVGPAEYNWLEKNNINS